MSQTNPPSKFPTVLLPAHLTACMTLEERLQGLSQTVTPKDIHYKAPKGHSETQFERDLWQFFPHRIQVGLVMPRAGQTQPYVPDFAYIDTALNLHLDIEVDEPYTHDTRQPLHYWGSEKDDRRNQFFLDAGWVVIRFSERQVVKSPMSCCKTIASAIAAIIEDNSIMSPFRQVPTLKPEPRWTYEEAQQMAANAQREQYLPHSTATLPAPKRKSRKPAQLPPKAAIASASRTFYCPACGEGPIAWKGHYISCPTCHYDQFAK